MLRSLVGSEMCIRDRGDSVYVNNSKVVPKVVTPSIEQTLNIDPNERKKLRAMKNLKRSDVITDGGSHFYAFSAKVNSVQEVRALYKKVKIENATSDDIMCSYHVQKVKVKLENATSDDTMCSYSCPDDHGIQVQQYLDDMEHGAGSRILTAIQQSEMTNVVVFVVRQFDGKHIGYRRFHHIKAAASMALEQLR